MGSEMCIRDSYWDSVLMTFKACVVMVAAWVPLGLQSWAACVLTVLVMVLQGQILPFKVCMLDTVLCFAFTFFIQQCPPVYAYSCPLRISGSPASNCSL